MNRIVWNSSYHGRTFEFTDLEIIKGTLKDNLTESLIAENLAIDNAAFTIVEPEPDVLMDVNGGELFDSENDVLRSIFTAEPLSRFNYGDVVRIYHDDKLIDKMYLAGTEDAGDGTGKVAFKVESAMGLLSNQIHRGGLYSAARAGDIIEEIMGDIPYSIDTDVATTNIFGWLPYGSALKNLSVVLFAVGASVLKDQNGDVRFGFNQQALARDKSEDQIYSGAKLVKLSPATHIKLTEHSYFYSSSVDHELLYDNTDSGLAADKYEISFEFPAHDLIAEGLTIHSSGANYAVVSGVGTLKGQPYIHSMRVMSGLTGVVGEKNELSVEEATLVSPANSASVMKRLVNYYSQTEEVEASIITDDETVGTVITLPDPTDRENRITGYIKSQNKTFSNVLKSDIKVTAGWHPTEIGNDYNKYLIVNKDDLVNGRWNVPAELVGKDAHFVLFGGSQGGQGGWHGEQAHYKYGSSRTVNIYGDSYVGEVGSLPIGLNGGEGGLGGLIGKLIQFKGILAQSYSISFGDGGEGGAGGKVENKTDEDGWHFYKTTDPEYGEYGTHSVMGSYDTNNGISIGDGDYISLIDGSVLIKGRGEQGGRGGKGGNGGKSASYRWMPDGATIDYSAEGKGEDGESIGNSRGGIGSNGEATSYRRNDRKVNGVWVKQRFFYGLRGGSGGGGGAEGGANGSAGTTGSNQTYESDGISIVCYGELYWNGGNREYRYGMPIGGDGANAVSIPDQAINAGGVGGFGGGGGGACAQIFGAESKSYATGGSRDYGIGLFGKSGNGAKGGKGSDGFLIVYYKEEI